MISSHRKMMGDQLLLLISFLGFLFETFNVTSPTGTCSIFVCIAYIRISYHCVRAYLFNKMYCLIIVSSSPEATGKLKYYNISLLVY